MPRNGLVNHSPVSDLPDRKSNNMVRIGSRTWTSAQIEHLAKLIAAGSTAPNAALELRRSIAVIRAKARRLGTPFPDDPDGPARLRPPRFADRQ